MKRYGMLADGDRVLIGLSGGKDSLALVEVLAARQRIFKPRIEVIACHVGVENVPYESDIDYLRDFCESRGVPFRYEVTRFEKDRKEGRSECFLCSWSRRKALFRVAEELNCNKIALGHHKDDLLETYLMNIIYQGTTATMPPVLKLEKMPITFIRPLATIRERELQQLAEKHEYRKQNKNCPYEQVSNRSKIKALLAQLEELNPEVYGSLWGAMTNIQPDYLPKEV